MGFSPMKIKDVTRHVEIPQWCRAPKIVSRTTILPFLCAGAGLIWAPIGTNIVPGTRYYHLMVPVEKPQKCIELVRAIKLPNLVPDSTYNAVTPN